MCYISAVRLLQPYTALLLASSSYLYYRFIGLCSHSEKVAAFWYGFAHIKSTADYTSIHMDKSFIHLIHKQLRISTQILQIFKPAAESCMCLLQIFHIKLMGILQWYTWRSAVKFKSRSKSLNPPKNKQTKKNITNLLLPHLSLCIQPPAMTCRVCHYGGWMIICMCVFNFLF